MPIEFNVYPNITVTKKIIRAEINIVQLVLFELINLAVILYNEDNKVEKVVQLQLDKTNGYEEWTNDKWLVDWVKTKIYT